MEPGGGEPQARLIVDGMNVIGSRPDGWWRDRKGAMRHLVAMLESYARRTSDEVTLVLDARPFDLPQDPASRMQVVFAFPTVRNAGDDEIVRIVERDPDPSSLTVVTSDSGLAERIEPLGARVVTAGAFRRRLERLDGDR